MRFFSAAVIAVACSAALPSIATTKTLTKTLLRPDSCAIGSIAPTRISLIQAIDTVAAASTAAARPESRWARALPPVLSGNRGSNEKRGMRDQREHEEQAVDDQQNDRDGDAQVPRLGTAASPSRLRYAAGSTRAIAAR